MDTLRSELNAGRAILLQEVAKFSALPNATNYVTLERTMQRLQEAFQSVLDEQEKECAKR